MLMFNKIIILKQSNTALNIFCVIVSELMLENVLDGVSL